MHAGFGRNLTIAVKVTAVEVHDDKVAGTHHALIEASGSGEDAIGIEANGEVSFAGNDVAAFVEPAADKADIAAMLLFGTRGKLRH